MLGEYRLGVVLELSDPEIGVIFGIVVIAVIRQIVIIVFCRRVVNGELYKYIEKYPPFISSSLSEPTAADVASAFHFTSLITGLDGTFTSDSALP